MKIVVIIFSLFFSIMIFSQEGKMLEIEEVSEEEEELDNVPFSIIEEVPVYPGCEDNSDKKKCFSNSVVKLISRRFDTDLVNELGFEGGKKIRVYGQFKISKEGNVEQVVARAPHPRLKTEAIRVINLIPKMKPGRFRGKNVSVSYTLPIYLSVPEKTKEK